MRLIKNRILLGILVCFIFVSSLSLVIDFHKLYFPSEKPISWIKDGKTTSTTHYYLAYEDNFQLLRMEYFGTLFCFGLLCIVGFQEIPRLLEYLRKEKEKKK